MGYELSLTSIMIGLAIGIIVPIISNIVPIQNALGKNLRASLDASRSQVNDFDV